ncbi:MAG TPA: glycosyltransferase family 2 protein, partial [Pirellula sp.]|nr:glycosyltransferase family 2 protein [Pirellula sp.]
MEITDLSICIPSKNFGEFIGQTLRSIIDQAEDGLEIVVLDGGSTDNTEHVLREYASEFPALRFVRQERAMGLDRDLAAAVDLAKGRYCWLMSADDVLKRGAIQRIMQEIKLGLDTYVVNRTDCTRELVPVRERYWLRPSIEDRVFDFNDRSQILDYFSSARSIGALFSYVSSIIVRRESWKSMTIEDRALGTNYQHVLRLFCLLMKDGKHKYIRDSLVYCRGQNDSFLSKGDAGLAGRFMIDINGYHLLGEALFPDAEMRALFMGVMRYEHHWTTWIRLGIRISDDSTWKC